MKAGVGLNLYGGGSFFVTESSFLFGRNKDFFEAGGGLLVGFEGLGFGRAGYRYTAKKGFLFKEGSMYFPIDKIAFPSVGLGIRSEYHNTSTTCFAILFVPSNI